MSCDKNLLMLPLTPRSGKNSEERPGRGCLQEINGYDPWLSSNFHFIYQPRSFRRDPAIMSTVQGIQYIRAFPNRMNN